MQKVEMAVVGAGPAGLGAAVEAASYGVQVEVFDENLRPGGQLFKQIHKFFGSREHSAGIRGYRIGEQLLDRAGRLKVAVTLGAVVYGIYPENRLGVVVNGDTNKVIQAENILLAAGASEHSLSFPGSTLPGVMSAGAAQTMVNIHRVLPGKKVLMVGSGNVGLIVAYQLLQAGAEVSAVIDASPWLGGYGVHAAKLRRAGVPLKLGRTVVRADGQQELTSVIIASVDEKFRPIAGTEEELAVDTVCLAVGLTPLTELAWMCGCRFSYLPALGGHVPIHNADMETTVQGIFAAGDVTGVEEASTALEEGRLAGTAIAERLGCLDKEAAAVKKEDIRRRLDQLRTGPFGSKRKQFKDILMEEWPGYEKQ